MKILVSFDIKEKSYEVYLLEFDETFCILKYITQLVEKYRLFTLFDISELDEFNKFTNIFSTSPDLQIFLVQVQKMQICF